MKTLRLSQKQQEDNTYWMNHFEKEYSFTFLEPIITEIPYVSKIIKQPYFKQAAQGIEYYLLGSRPINLGEPLEKKLLQRKNFSEEEFTWFQNHNKLAISQWGTMSTIVIWHLLEHTKQEKLYDTITHPENQKYHAMTFEQKTQSCHKIDQQLITILEQMYQKQTQK